MNLRDPRPAVAFQPALRVADPEAARWLAEVTLRLRREVCWLWRERGLLLGAGNRASSDMDGLLPPLADPLRTSLDLARYDNDKRAFLEHDETARWLGEEIAGLGATDASSVPFGGFAWVAGHLALAPAERFVLALALAGATDSAAGSVFAACQNDATRTHPSLALAQRLWDAPEAILALADPGHRLYRHGLLAGPAGWDSPLAIPPAVARQLAFPEPATLPMAPARPAIGATLDMTLARLRSAPDDVLRIQPILGHVDTPVAQTVAELAGALDSRVARPVPGAHPQDLASCLTLAWLRGDVAWLDFDQLDHDGQHDHPVDWPLPGLPMIAFVGIDDPGQAKRLPARATLPTLRIAALDYAGRLSCWHEGLASMRAVTGMDAAIADCARRFRFEAAGIARVCRTLGALGRMPTPSDLFAACRGDVDLGELAQRVVPRFSLDELMLPAKQAGQVRELIQAAAALTRVHHEWGTARAWDESGLSALFSGPPGTGKTMAAEVIASAVGMPMYRIDLSQVVNKYIGETEKNLRRLFDAADAADVILFFDEADALFGKRTEVKDAHDRYANLEVSYLLERMERFKGMAILATNRKKDLDEAFLRRLRYVVEFPLPGPEERVAIWQRAIPEGIAHDSVDFAFLARQFPLAGGHIRSIVFQACLQGAARDVDRCLDMPLLLSATRRELDKLGRPVSPDLFGPWRHLIEE